MDISALKEFTSRFINDVHRDEISEEEKATKAQELTDKLVPEFRRLKKIDFEPVVAMPDKECRDEIIERIENRTKAAETDKTVEGTKFRGREKEVELFDGLLKMGERQLATGNFSKLPIHKGQTFLDAYDNNEIERVEKQNVVVDDKTQGAT